MELVKYNLNRTSKHFEDKIVITIGEFDGLHKAHRQLIQKVKQIGDELKLKTALMTFYPHPAYVIGKRNEKGYITPLEDKIALLGQENIDYLIVVDFTEELAKMNYRDFESKVLGSFNIDKIVVGYDFKYGFKGMGNVNTLKQKYDLIVIDEIKYENQKIGSTVIRNYLINGKIDKVNKLLGRFFSITGCVTYGSKIGRKIGLPTANLEIDDDYYNLKKGVYAVFVIINNKKYYGICNIGNNPSFNYIEKARAEVHILDFNDNIYDELIKIEFVHYLRDEIKFNTPKDLVDQVKKDIDNTRRILDENSYC